MEGTGPQGRLGMACLSTSKKSNEVPWEMQNSSKLWALKLEHNFVLFFSNLILQPGCRTGVDRELGKLGVTKVREEMGVRETEYCLTLTNRVS